MFIYNNVKTVVLSFSTYNDASKARYTINLFRIKIIKGAVEYGSIGNVC